MIAGMSAVIRDVKIAVDGALMKRWSKDAFAVRDSEGNLVCWDPSMPKPKKK